MGAIPASAPFSGPFWVSPSGSDTVGDGTQGNPWRQIQKAVDFIRTNRLNQAMHADIVVNARQGSYQPIALTTLDSGFNGYSVRYVSFDGPGKAVVDAGVQVTNWTNVSGNIFKTPAPGGNPFWTMYENGKRSQVCRTPKRSPDANYPCSKYTYIRTQSGATNPDLTHLYYNPGDFNPAGWSTSDLQVFEYSGGDWVWFSDTTPVSAIDTTNHILTLSQQAKFNIYQDATGSPYFVQGVQSMQSDPGEFYLDRAGGWLYYIARDGDIHNQTIVVPTAQEAITLTGTSWKDGDRVSHVVFDGIAVQNTDHVQWYRPGWPVSGPGVVLGPTPNPWPIGYIYAWQACMPQFQKAAVRFTNADNCTFTNGHVLNAGMYGVLFTGYGKNHTVSNSWLERSALANLRCEGQFPGLGDVLRDCTFTNIRSNDSGELSSQGPIQFANSGHHSVSYCEIYNSPRQGIWIVADNSGDLTDPANQIYTGGTTIDHVLLRNCCQESADDGALGLDSFGNASGRHSQVVTMSQIISRNNVIDPRIGASPLAAGLFTDDQTWGQTFQNVWSHDNSISFRINNSGEHSYTNCSFLSDGSPDPSFNSSLMDTANIGTTAGFPY